MSSLRDAILQQEEEQKSSLRSAIGTVTPVSSLRQQIEKTPKTLSQTDQPGFELTPESLAKETGKAGITETGQVQPTQDIEILATVLSGGAAAPVLGSKILGGGLIGAGENLAIDIADSIAEGKLPDAKETAINAGLGLAGGAAGATIAKGIGKFGGKIKALAKLRKTTPNQINKELQQTAKATGVSRGDVLDDLLRKEGVTDDLAVFHAPETRAIPEQIDDAVAQLNTNKEIFPDDFNAEKLVEDLGREPDKILPNRNINISRMDDTQLENFITNLSEQSDEFKIPNEKIGWDTLKGWSNQVGSDTIVSKYIRDVDAGRTDTPEGGIRKLVAEVLAAEDVLKNHLETTTLKLAKEVAEGSGNRETLKQAITTDLRLLRKTGAVSSEFGRALGSRNIKATGETGANQRFLKQISKLLDNDDALDEAARRLSNIDILDPTERILFLKGLTKSTTSEKIQEWWFNSILSGPTTQMRNLLGNTGTIISRELERPFATLADTGISTVRRVPRQRFFRESVASAFGIKEGLREGLLAGWKSFKTEVPQFGNATKLDEFVNSKRIGGAIGGKKGKIIRLPGRFLLATDDFFKAVAYRMEVNAQSYRQARKIANQKKLGRGEMFDLYNELRANPSEFLDEAARKEALVRTFQTEPGQITQGFMSFRDKIPGMRYVLPFLRTPFNIAEFAIDRVPGANIVSILNRYRQGLPTDISEEAGKTAIGLLTAAGVMQAYEHGLINGSAPERKGDKRAFYATNQQAYSFNINGTSYSFKNLEPVSTVLGIAADMAQAQHEGIPLLSQDAALMLGKSVGRNITSKSFALGMKTAMDFAVGDYDEAREGIARTLSGFTPASSFTRSVAKSVDPTLRRTNSIEDAIKQNIPFMSDDLEPVMDIWGNDVVTEQSVVAQIFDGMINPIDIKALSQDKATLEINRLIQQFPDESFSYLGEPQRYTTIKGKKVELPRELYIQYVKESGQLAHQRVMALIQHPMYRNMPDEEKKRLIEKRISEAREETRGRLFGDIRKAQ